MNCKPGDLAIYVGAQPKFLGFVTRVIRRDDDWSGAVAWIVDPPMPKGCMGRPDWIQDAALRPIRDNDADDETLTWAGRPADIKTPEAV